MSKKIKMIAIPLLVISAVSIGIYTTSSSNKGKIVEKVEASAINPDEVAKQSIQDKMLNSIDYFKSAKGSFRDYIKKDNSDDTIEFDVKLNGKPVSYVKVTNSQDSLESIFDGDNYLSVNNKVKDYDVSPVYKGDSNAPKPPKSAKQRYRKGADGKIKSVILNSDPAFMGRASSVLYNQNVALGFLEDFNKWKIQGDDVFLGLPVTVIAGELPDGYKSRFDGTSFKIWVQKDTGIILNLEIYNDSNEVVAGIKVNDIQLNSNYTASDDEKFKIKLPKGYTAIQHLPKK
jgi:outer membrane lipoprotein-sorting protein